MHKKGGMACKPSPLSGGPSRTYLNCPNRATIFHLMRHPSDWTKAFVNAKKIPASLAGIFPPSLWPSLREAKIQEFNTRSLLSLGIPDATNRKAVMWLVAVVVDILTGVGQIPVPHEGAIGRGTPPVSDVPSAFEAIVEAEAAGQTCEAARVRAVSIVEPTVGRLHLATSHGTTAKMVSQHRPLAI